MENSNIPAYKWIPRISFGEFKFNEKIADHANNTQLRKGEHLGLSLEWDDWVEYEVDGLEEVQISIKVRRKFP